MCPQNLECVALSVRKLWRAVPNFKFRSRDPDHAHFRGQFVLHWLVHVMVSVRTKYEVSIFGHSKDIKGVPKFRKWSRDLSHALWGSIFYTPTKGFIKFISSQNLECVSLSVPKLWRVPNFKFRSRDPDYAHFRG